jgi:hypothetical protein
MSIPPGEPPEYMRPKNEEARQTDGLPQTQTQTSRSVAKKEIPPAEDFERVPRTLGRELARGELDYHEFAIACAIATNYDYRTGELLTSLAGLADLISWNDTPEYLRQQLDSLREKGWIDYSARRGPKAKYIIQLGPTWVASSTRGGHALSEALSGELPASLQLRPPSQLETNSNSPLLELPANTDEQREETPFEFPTGPSPIDVDVDVDVDRDFRDGVTSKYASLGNVGFPELCRRRFDEGHMTVREYLHRRSLHEKVVA